MRKSAKQAVNDVVNNEKLNGHVIENLDVLEALPELFDSLRINGAYVAKVLREANTGDSKSFIENLLGVFGCSVVKTSAIQYRLERFMGVPIAKDNLICVDEAQLKESVDKIAKTLSEKEEQKRENNRNSANKNNTYVSRIDDLEQKNAKLLTEYEYLFNNILTDMQEMYVENVKNNLPVNKVEETLANMGVKVITSTENAEVTTQMAFTVLKVSSIENRINKPCFIKNNKVVLKGVLYELANEEV